MILRAYEVPTGQGDAFQAFDNQRFWKYFWVSGDIVLLE
jgi:hypothetical protein